MMARGAVFAAAILAGLGLAAGCDSMPSGSPASQPAAKPPPPVPAKTARAMREDFAITVSAIGWVEPYASLTIKPQVAGQLKEIHFREGDELTPGQVLFTIDPRPFEAALHLAEAMLARDQALADDAQLEARRAQSLFDNNQGTDRERDATRFAADSRLAQVRADEADIERAKLNLEYCTIRAPFAARAGSYLVYRGYVLKENEAEMVVINQLSPIYVTFSLPEQYLAQVQESLKNGGVSVLAEFDDVGAARESGTLAFLNNEVDKSTGMIKLKATFENQNRRLWPGRFVRVSLATRTLPDTVVVPAPAVQPGQGGMFVYVVRPDQTVAMSMVEVGPTIDGRTAILRGLAGDEEVVTDGHLRLTPGAAIEVKNAQPTSQAVAKLDEVGR
jgi:multidrug efflux system membrane fusion protein